MLAFRGGIRAVLDSSRLTVQGGPAGTLYTSAVGGWARFRPVESQSSIDRASDAEIGLVVRYCVSTGLALGSGTPKPPQFRACRPNLRVMERRSPQP